MRTDQAPSGDPLGVLGSAPPGFMDALSYPYFQSVFDRKSRRVALGMTVGSDVIPYESPYEPVPLSELEEALLVMAGTGLGPAGASMLTTLPVLCLGIFCPMAPHLARRRPA